MAPDRYDVIVIGARCAGSPTAMLLARKGYRVLLVDRATFPSDTLSTHVVHPPGVAALDRLGPARPTARHRLPAHRHVQLRLRTVHARRAPRGLADSPVAYCPRRTVLDKLLVDAAARGRRRGPRGVHRRRDRSSRTGASSASAGTRQAVGRSSSTRDVVIGADGRFSSLAKAVGPEQYHEAARSSAGYYTYWSGLPAGGCFAVDGPPGARLGGGADPRRSHAGRRRLAVRASPGHVQARRRRQLPEDVRPRAGVRRADPGRHARGALRRHRGRELLPQAVRTGLGARRRRRVQQGPDHRAGHHRRVPRRRAVRRRARRSALADAAVRRGDGRVPGHTRRARRCRCTSSPASWRPSSHRRPRCNSSSRPCTATRMRWTGSHG